MCGYEQYSTTHIMEPKLREGARSVFALGMFPGCLLDSLCFLSLSCAHSLKFGVKRAIMDIVQARNLPIIIDIAGKIDNLILRKLDCYLRKWFLMR